MNQHFMFYLFPNIELSSTEHRHQNEEERGNGGTVIFTTQNILLISNIDWRGILLIL